VRTISAGAVVGLAGAALLGAVVASGWGSGPPVATAASPSSGTQASETQGITVTATGEAEGTPDELLFAVATEVGRPRADAALSASSSVAARVAAALRAAGIASGDIRTSGLEVYAARNSHGTVTGWTARTSLAVSVRDLRRAGPALDGAVAAGGAAIRVNDLSYALADPEALMATARAQAFQRARERAAAYASASGRSLGPVLQVVEGGGSVAPSAALPQADLAAGSAASIDPGALQPGSAHVSVTTTVRWSFA